MAIRIAIFEDNNALRESLVYLLKNADGYEVVGDYNNCLEAGTIVRVYEPDVVLMDIDMPEQNGIQGVRAVKEARPQTSVIMYTVFEDDEKIFRAIAAGASGYLLKRTEPAVLIQSIKELMDGGAPISSRVAQKVLSAFRQTMPKASVENPLSEREQEVLSLIAAGSRNKEVADKLSVSVATVKSHIYNIYQKLHVNSRVEAINKFRNQP